jgi:uncharacterized membrane protein
MKKNVGTTEKVIRLVIAVLFIILFVTHVVSGVLGYVLLALAVIFILTSLIGWCPIWAVFGVNTTAKK